MILALLLPVLWSVTEFVFVRIILEDTIVSHCAPQRIYHIHLHIHTSLKFPFSSLKFCLTISIIWNMWMSNENSAQKRITKLKT